MAIPPLFDKFSFIMNVIIWIIIISVVVLLIAFYMKRHKAILYNCVAIFTGAPKTGKSALSVQQAIKKYKRNLMGYYIRLPFLWWKTKNEYNNDFKAFERVNRPMLYSNIKLRHVKHNRFTLDILLRKVRIPNKSVVLLDETSIIADSMLFKDKDINDNLMWFVKLFGHYSHGGTLILNTQSIADNHYSIKRCVSSYYRIFLTIRLPFFSLMKVRECVYSEDGDTINNYNEDTDNIYKFIFISNRVFKSYDKYCYSILTDDLTIQVDYDAPILGKNANLKTKDIVTLQDIKNLYRSDKK